MKLSHPNDRELVLKGITSMERNTKNIYEFIGKNKQKRNQ